MEVGIFILMQQRGYHQTSAEVLRGAVEQTVAADQAGFDTAWYAEHQSLDEVAALVEWTDCIGCAGPRGSAGQAHGNRLQPASQLAHPRRGGSMTHTQTPPAQGREHRNGTHHDPRAARRGPIHSETTRTAETRPAQPSRAQVSRLPTTDERYDFIQCRKMP